jgi:hypothetical protein
LFFALIIFLAAAKLAIMGKIDFLLEAPFVGELMRMEL